jgi:hypothetical protein
MKLHNAYGYGLFTGGSVRTTARSGWDALSSWSRAE